MPALSTTPLPWWTCLTERGGAERERDHPLHRPSLSERERPQTHLSFSAQGRPQTNGNEQLLLPSVALIGRSPRSTLGVCCPSISPFWPSPPANASATAPGRRGSEGDACTGPGRSRNHVQPRPAGTPRQETLHHGENHRRRHRHWNLTTVGDRPAALREPRATTATAPRRRSGHSPGAAALPRTGRGTTISRGRHSTGTAI